MITLKIYKFINIKINIYIYYIMNYEIKYLKYKLKYLNLKKIYGGSNDNDNNNNDENDIKDLIHILQQVEDSIKNEEDPIEANRLERESLAEAQKNQGEKNQGENVEFKIEDSNIGNVVQNNRDAINHNRGEIDVNRVNIENLFNICKAQQEELIKISRMLRNLFSIQQKKLFKEWKDNYRANLKAAIDRKNTWNSGT